MTHPSQRGGSEDVGPSPGIAAAGLGETDTDLQQSQQSQQVSEKKYNFTF